LIIAFSYILVNISSSKKLGHDFQMLNCYGQTSNNFQSNKTVPAKYLEGCTHA